jgi:hypothetical protein
VSEDIEGGPDYAETLEETEPLETTSLSRSDIKARQHRLNLFIKDTKLKGVGAIREDSAWGPASKKRVREVKFWLGWMRENINGEWNEKFHQAMLYPNNRKLNPGWKRGIARRKAHNADYYASFTRPGITTFDGVRVAKAAVPHLKYARDGGWPGRLVSGWRSAWYSRSLCIAMCGQPTCPGRCAGVNTNHRFMGPENFAIDVSYYIDFGKRMPNSPYKPKIYNALGARDPVHFSPSGR